MVCSETCVLFDGSKTNLLILLSLLLNGCFVYRIHPNVNTDPEWQQNTPLRDLTILVEQPKEEEILNSHLTSNAWMVKSWLKNSGIFHEVVTSNDIAVTPDVILTELTIPRKPYYAHPYFVSISFGIVPQGFKDEWEAVFKFSSPSGRSILIKPQEYTINTWQGWLPLLLAPLKSWKLLDRNQDYNEEVIFEAWLREAEPEIMKLVAPDE